MTKEALTGKQLYEAKKAARKARLADRPGYREPDAEQEEVEIMLERIVDALERIADALAPKPKVEERV